VIAGADGEGCVLVAEGVGADQYVLALNEVGELDRLAVTGDLGLGGDGQVELLAEQRRGLGVGRCALLVDFDGDRVGAGRDD